MRVSEKTIEINFCAQFDAGGGRPPFWVGLTQQQEKRAGYDVFTTTLGRLLVLQFKASAHVLKSGVRRFHAPHHQLLALQDRLGGSRDIYYVLPGFGHSAELRTLALDVVSNCWLLSVADIGPIAPPTGRHGALRKNQKHYMDLDETTATVTIHSEPVNVQVTRASELPDGAMAVGTSQNSEDLGDRSLPASQSPLLQFQSYDDFDQWTKKIGSKAIGLFIPS